MSAPASPSNVSALIPTLARRIIEMIRREGYPVGHRLTEQALCDELDVSRSPVRKALQYLEQLGALGSEPNKGFFVAKDPAGLRRIVLPASEESDEAVYMKILQDRVSKALPDEISESDLMQRHDLTRLQVQRALNRMAREGMADRKPGRGWVFRDVLNTVEAHRESYRFRMIIEPAAMLEPTFRIDKAAFARIRREQRQLLDGGIETWSTSERFRAGCDCHETIMACSHNRFLIEALRGVNQLRRVMEYGKHTDAAEDRARLYRQCEEHLQLLDLLEAGERMEASHLMREHLNVARILKTETSFGQDADDAPSRFRPHPLTSK